MADGDIPTYTSSLITAVARLQQGLAAPSFIMGGLSDAGEYALFKKSNVYAFNEVRYQPKHIGRPFLVTRIVIPLLAPLSDGQKIVPVLHFDSDSRTSPGTLIDFTTNPDGDNKILVTPDAFGGNVFGTFNFFLEIQQVGSALCPIGNDVIVDVDVETTP